MFDNDIKAQKMSVTFTDDREIRQMIDIDKRQGLAFSKMIRENPIKDTTDISD